jgi:hypothetical protein
VDHRHDALEIDQKKKKKKKTARSHLSPLSGEFKPFSTPQLTRSLPGAKDRGAHGIPSDAAQQKTYFTSTLVPLSSFGIRKLTS